MLIAMHGVKLCVHYYSWSEPFSHCYTLSEAICSFIYMQ